MAENEAVTVTHADIRVLSRAARIHQTLKQNPKSGVRPEFEKELVTLRASWKKFSPAQRARISEYVKGLADLHEDTVPEVIDALESDYDSSPAPAASDATNGSHRTEG